MERSTLSETEILWDSKIFPVIVENLFLFLWSDDLIAVEYIMEAVI
jgi:hypothetical protein